MMHKSPCFLKSLSSLIIGIVGDWKTQDKIFLLLKWRGIVGYFKSFSMVPFGMVPLGLSYHLWCLLAWCLLVFPILCGAFWHIIKVMDKERDKNIYRI